MSVSWNGVLYNPGTHPAGKHDLGFPSVATLSARILQVCANHTHCSGNSRYQDGPRRFTALCKCANTNYVLSTSRWSLGCTHGILPAWVPACCLFRLAQMSQAHRNSWWLQSLTNHKRHLLYLWWKKTFFLPLKTNKQKILARWEKYVSLSVFLFLQGTS